MTAPRRLPPPRLLRATWPLTGLLALALGGCAPKYQDYQAFLKEPRPLVTATDYRVAPPDVIQITSKRVREINNHREMIRPDGKVTLPLLGSVFIAGLTCEEASAALEQMAREYYEDADVSLRVAVFNSKKIFIFGEVSYAGPLPYDGTNTVLGVLARAQPTRLADPSNIHVLRPGRDGELIHRMTVNLDKMVKQGDVTHDAVLEEGDILYIPPNGFAAVGLALQQVLLPVLPAAAVVKGPSDIESLTTGSRYGRASDDLNY